MPRLRTGSTMMSFPPFSGVTARLVVANVGIFFALLLMQYAAPAVLVHLLDLLALTPALVFHGWVWQLATYSFLHSGVLHVALNMLTLWFIGSYLESPKGAAWLLQVYFFSLVGGAAIGSLLSLTHLFHSDPRTATVGSDAAIFGLMAAFAVLFGDQKMILFPLPVAIKARYLVIIYMLIDVAFLLAGGPALTYFTILGGALIGFLSARYLPHRRSGFGQGWWDKWRNKYYRWKRRRAARKFEVYMRGQNREVHFDNEGRYIDPDERRDPNDRKWMN